MFYGPREPTGLGFSIMFRSIFQKGWGGRRRVCG
jgi:hypothetical protein